MDTDTLRWGTAVTIMNAWPGEDQILTMLWSCVTMCLSVAQLQSSRSHLLLLHFHNTSVQLLVIFRYRIMEEGSIGL